MLNYFQRIKVNFVEFVEFTEFVKLEIKSVSMLTLNTNKIKNQRNENRKPTENEAFQTLVMSGSAKCGYVNKLMN